MLWVGLLSVSVAFLGHNHLGSFLHNLIVHSYPRKICALHNFHRLLRYVDIIWQASMSCVQECLISLFFFV